MMGLIVDLFAGGGGASTGLEMAFGRSPDIAINHDPEAIAMHKANHPETVHLCANVLRVLPLEATRGRPVDWLHASPDCTHFSKAKGGKPRSQFIRDLAWVVVRWAEDTRPTVISLENVEEFQTWGPLNRSGMPIKSQAGEIFRSWVRRLRRLGYKVGWRVLRACDYGAPTTRKRFFVIARRDGRSIIWPKPTHGDPKSAAVRSGKLLPWRTAAACIDWTQPVQSIFERKKPLAENTQRRIAEGIRRYVLQSPQPFLVTYYGPKGANDFRGSSLEDPLKTQSTENRFGFVAPYCVNLNHTTKDGSYAPFRGKDIASPLGAITQHPGFAVAAPVLSRQFGRSIGQGLDSPHPTITQSNHDMLAVGAVEQSACLIKYYGQGIGSDIDTPAHTVTSKDRMGLTVLGIGSEGRYEKVRDFLRSRGVIGREDEAEFFADGKAFRIADIGLRMLKPRELYRAQGFGDEYVIAPEHKGKLLTNTAQVRMCGNSVPPQFIHALATANGPDTWAAPRPLKEMPLLQCSPPVFAGQFPAAMEAMP